MGGWDNLRAITWRRACGFVDRKGNYLGATIKAVNDHQIVLSSWSWSSEGRRTKHKTGVIQRQNLLKVTAAPGPLDVVYPGESSWAYGVELQHAPRLWRALAVTKDGKRTKGKLIEVSDVMVRLSKGNQTLETVKDQISQVYCLREKPISARTEYGIQEMGRAEPHMWSHALPMVPMMPVLIFDASLSEARP
jgi:hypothetical protein